MLRHQKTKKHNEKLLHIENPTEEQVQEVLTYFKQEINNLKKIRDTYIDQHIEIVDEIYRKRQQSENDDVPPTPPDDDVPPPPPDDDVPPPLEGGVEPKTETKTPEVDVEPKTETKKPEVDVETKTETEKPEETKTPPNEEDIRDTKPDREDFMLKKKPEVEPECDDLKTELYVLEQKIRQTRDQLIQTERLNPHKKDTIQQLKKQKKTDTEKYNKLLKTYQTKT
jgi:hypothetical protein